MKNKPTAFSACLEHKRWQWKCIGSIKGKLGAEILELVSSGVIKAISQGEYTDHIIGKTYNIRGFDE